MSAAPATRNRTHAMNTNAMPSAQQLADANRLLDPETRRQIRADPRRFAADIGLLDVDAAAVAAVDVRVVTNTRDTLYIQLPGPSVFAEELDDAALGRIQAAGSNGTAGTTTSASTLSTATSTAGCASTASTIGTAGSAE